MAGSRRRFDDEQDGPFAAEVYAVMVAGLASVRSTADFPRLANAANARLGRDELSSVSVRDLTALLEAAIGQLDPIDQNAAPHLLGMTYFNGKRLSYDEGNGSLEGRYIDAANNYRVGNAKPAAATFRTKLARPIIVSLGRAVEAVYFTAQAQAQAADLPLVDNSYVRRPLLEAQLQKVRKYYSVIQLVGEPGTGKTLLATWFAHASVGQNATMVIHASSPAEMVQSVRREMETIWEGAGLSDLGVESNFSKFLTRPRRFPQFVVFDDVRQESLLDEILPAKLSATVVLTTQSRLTLRRHKNWVARIGPMEQGEAEELIRTYLPDSSDEVVDALSHLHGRAAALYTVCAYLARRGFHRGRNHLLQSLISDAAEALDYAAGELQTVSLAESYRQLVASLASSSKTGHCIKLLQLFVALDRTSVSPRLLLTCFRALYGTTLGSFAYHSAVTVLQRYEILRRRWPEGETLDTLTFSMMRYLLDPMSGDELVKISAARDESESSQDL